MQTRKVRQQNDTISTITSPEDTEDYKSTIQQTTYTTVKILSDLKDERSEKISVAPTCNLIGKPFICLSYHHHQNCRFTKIVDFNPYLQSNITWKTDIPDGFNKEK